MLLIASCVRPQEWATGVVMLQAADLGVAVTSSLRDVLDVSDSVFTPGFLGLGVCCLMLISVDGRCTLSDPFGGRFSTKALRAAVGVNRLRYVGVMSTKG